jgi:hypothetical protein
MQQKTKLNQRYYEQKDIYPFLSNFNEHFSEIRKEIENCVWFQWPEKYLWNKKGDDWKVYPFYGFETWNKNIEKFPILCQLLKEVPGLKTAILSRLGPNTHLKPHQGWADLANHVLRCQLGIYIPTDAKSGVTVEGEFKQVKENEWIVFDDSKMHTGLNEGTTDRIVLLLDIERPDYIEKGKSKVKNTNELNHFIEQMKKI